ncbi:MAG: S9 family peptidase [Chloroflexi bacterium]|nr:S9 family peptidase [Chloroflexota bacterium]
MSEIIEKHSILPDDLFKLKILQDALLSPDGKKAVYGVSWVETDTMDEYTNLWLVDIASGQSRQLTYGKWHEGGAAWSPDGKQIAFLSNRIDSKPQIFLIAPDGGEARQLTKLEQGVGSGPVWSPDGKQIAFTAAGLPQEKPDPKKPYRVTRNVYRFDGAGYLDPIVQDIFIIDMVNDVTKRLTNDRFSNHSPNWSPDGRQILFTAMMNPDSFALSPTLKAVDMDGNVHVILDEEWGNIDSACFTPDGKQIVFVGEPEGQKIATRNQMWLVDAEGKTKPKSRSSKLGYSFCGALRSDLPKAWRAMGGTLMIFNKDGSAVYTTVHVAGSIFIYKIALQGPESCQPLVANPERPAVLMDAGEQSLLYAVSSPDLPCDLFVSDLDGKNEHRLTHLNDAVLAEWSIAFPEHIQYTNQNSATIEGWLMKPSAGEGPFPTVLYIHGGPHSAYGNMFSFDYQMLAGAGYAVLYLNPSGSSGYGDDFANSILANWGDLVFDDLMRGVDLAIEKGIADPDKLGCYGLSYGGYMSCWIVGHTSRFKAAIPENPVSNLVSFYGTSDIGPRFLEEEMEGTLIDKFQLYVDQSPVTYAHKAVTPTLMIQGEADYRCPAEQSEQFYTILKAHGCTVEMVRLPGSPHAGSIGGAPIVRQYANHAMLDWFNKYIKGE